MKNIPVYALIAATALTGQACSSRQNAQADASVSPREQLRSLLADVAGSPQVMFGHHDDTAYGLTWRGDPGRSDVLEAVGDYPAVMSWDLGGIELGDSVNLDGVPFSRIRTEAIAQAARGGINTFSWHPRNFATGGDSWDTSDSLTVSHMMNDSTVNASYMRSLSAIAVFFNSLTDADGNDVAVIFRPWHEHTGGWFWWGTPNCTPEQYHWLWTSAREVMDAANVDNVLWAYSPDRVKSAEQYMERYPGDEMVDIVGTDVYHFNGAEGADTYRQDASRSLEIVDSIATARGKIPAFTETGLEGLSLPGWYTDDLMPLLRDARVAYVVVWRNAPDKPGHFYVPVLPEHGLDAFRSFYADSLTMFAKDIRNKNK